jgi:hypothetical protein
MSSDHTVCRYHFDSGPSVTAVLTVVDNGTLGTCGLTMNSALLGHSSRRDGDIKYVTYKDPMRAITYREVSYAKVSHGDVYVFPGCAVMHGVCNPQLSMYANHKYKIARRQVRPQTFSHAFTSHVCRRMRR